MHSKSDSIEIMIDDKADELIEERFQSLPSRYQIGLETSIRDSNLIFDCVHLLFYKCYKINFKHGGSYIHYPDWTKDKKATINPMNKKDNKCFQYAVTVALNYEEIKKESQKMTKLKPFIDKYNSAEINYLPEKDDWKKIQENNLTIALNVLYTIKEKICPTYVSKNTKNKLSY